MTAERAVGWHTHANILADRSMARPGGFGPRITAEAETPAIARG